MGLFIRQWPGLAESSDLATLIARFAAVDKKDKGAKGPEELAEAEEALLGGAPVPFVTISQAFDILTHPL